MQLPSILAPCAAVAVIFPPVHAEATVLGPAASRCSDGGGPAVLVRIVGLKDRSGQIRVRSFGGSPSTYFDKRYALTRIEIPTPKSGSVDICVPVSAPGFYALDVRHDTNGNGRTDKADGAGASGNPPLSFWDVVFKRKPPASKVQVSVGKGMITVSIRVLYLSGGSFGPSDGTL